jgi:phenylacetate-CoA ligase
MVQMDLHEIYGRMPAAVQDVFATGYGLRQLAVRHTGEYQRFVRELEARQWWSTDRLVADQDARVRRLATWCAAAVPYYRELFADLGLRPSDLRSAADLAKLPILEKETVRSDPDRFLPDLRRPKLVGQTTGGTTGTPLRYWATRLAIQFNYAVYESRSRRWAGVKLGDRMASFHGQPIVPASVQHGPYWRRNLAFNQLYFSVYHLNDATLPEYVRELEHFSPRVMVGYTSAIHRVASHLLSTGDVGRIRPAAVMVSSETLFPSARRDIEQAFGCRVQNSYSLGELVAYVSECDCGELHVSPEYGVVELVDLGGGTEIVATGLANYGMPLLRYRTGDLATAAPGPSSCGRGLPRLGDLTGRSDDVVRTPEGSVVGPAPMSLAFQRVPNLRRAQVRQDSVDRLTVLLEVTDAYGSEDQAFLEAELRRRLGSTISLDFQQVAAIARTSGGKERLVISTIPAAGA